MYKIGEFSKLAKISTKSLHFYDEMGIFKPCEVNDTTGYRYYSVNQLIRLYRIISLRDFGFTINEIKDILNDDKSSYELQLLLTKRKQEINCELTELKSKLIRVETYLLSLEQESSQMECSVVIKDVPSLLTASIRGVLYDYSSFNDLFQTLKANIQSQKITTGIPSYSFTIYYDNEYKENNIEVEICQIVADEGLASTDITFKTMPPILAACILHKGSYKTIRLSYSYLMKWIDENGYEVVGPFRECYLDGIISNNNLDNVVTEIQVPILKRIEGDLNGSY